MRTNPRLHAALTLAGLGFKVIPLDGKHPFAGSRGYKDGTTSRRQIKARWAEHPEANVGIVCSSVTGPIVIDVDGPEGMRAAQLLGLPHTRTATSGRPHRQHWYFMPPLSGASVKRSLNVKPQLDILGDAGYVVAPPSLHPETGKPYHWTSRAPMVPLPENVVRLVNGDSAGGASRKSAAPPLPEILREGQRDNQLTSLAGSMRRRGATESTILAALRTMNVERCRPPLADAQLLKIARSVAKYVPADRVETLDDIGNAQRYVRLHGQDVRFVPAGRSWLVWDERRWAPDATREAQRRAEDVVGDILAEAQARRADEDALKALTRHAANTASHRKRSDMLETVKHQKAIVIRRERLNSDPWLLNVENGTLDLRTGLLRAHDRADLLTKLAPVTFDPAARCSKWDAFLDRVMAGDQELVAFLRRAIGYSLVGITTEECFFFCYGTGRNGKTTFLETIYAILGDYAVLTDFHSFLANRFHRESRDTPRLAGIRFAMANETPTDARFDEATVKQLTSTDTVHARELYHEPFSFRPTHTLWLRANDKPAVRDTSIAFWRRIKLIPFVVRITPREQVKNLGEQLQAEASGILNWAITGCLEWQRLGLAAPARVVSATNEYRKEEDVIGEFVEACCREREGVWTATAHLYQAFTSWWIETRGMRTALMSSKAFGRALERRGNLTPAKQRGARGWLGIGLLSVTVRP